MTSEFYCVKCGNKGVPIWRKKGQNREAGHLKKIYCIHCKEETNHCECSGFKYSHDDFIFEYENGNFDEDGNRKLSMGKLRNKILGGGIYE